MGRVIRIDDEVERELKNRAVTYDMVFGTPNDVLRLILGLDDHKEMNEGGPTVATQPNGRRTGEKLAREWNVDVSHALYRESGDWYHHLRAFPGAYFDRNGYVVFRSGAEYEDCTYLDHGRTVHVQGGISSIPSYVRKGLEVASKRPVDKNSG